MKVYLSGPITTIGTEQAKENFQKAENTILGFRTLINEDIEVVNPMKLKHDHDKSWKSYMKEDIKHLLECDAIFLLPGHAKSKGAKIELQIAKSMNMTVIMETEHNELYMDVCPKTKKAENIFAENFKKNMIQNDIDTFKVSFRTLYNKVIIPSMLQMIK